MSDKWYKLKNRNFQGISDQDFLPPERRTPIEETWGAKGPLAHCEAIRDRLLELKYPAELYIEECENDGKLYPPNLTEEEWEAKEKEEAETDSRFLKEYDKQRMAMVTEKNKKLIKKTQAVLKKHGYDVKTGHLYELFSELAGFKSYNVANAKNADFLVLMAIEEEA